MELEPFSQRVVELKAKGLFHEPNFEFAPLGRLEWVAPRVTASNLGRAVSFHLDATESRLRRQGINPFGRKAVEAHPELPEALMRSDHYEETHYILQKAKEFLDSDHGKQFLAAGNPPSQVLWNAQEGMTALQQHLRQLSEHFPDFYLDFASNNFLFAASTKRVTPFSA